MSTPWGHRGWRRSLASALFPATDVGKAADLDKELHAALELGEEESLQGMRTTEDILAAADERDDRADARDLAAVTRETDLDREKWLARDGEYGLDWPERRAAAIDRESAKQDRIAARLDRLALVDRGARRRSGGQSVPQFTARVRSDGVQTSVSFSAGSWEAAVDLLHDQYGPDPEFVLRLGTAAVQQS